MTKDQLRSMNVSLAGRTYPLKVQDGEEQEIIHVAKELNEKIHAFQLAFQKNDRQDSLAMTLLTLAMEMHQLKKKGPLSSQSESVYTDRLLKIEKLLEQVTL